jgi:hypothetical protein
MNISKEELLRPFSVFAWQSSSSALTDSTEGVTSPLQPPLSGVSLSASGTNDAAGNNKYAGRTQTIFNTAMQYKVHYLFFLLFYVCSIFFFSITYLNTSFF